LPHFQKLTFSVSSLLAIFSSNLSQALFGAVLFASGTIIVRAQWPQLQQLVNVTGSGAYYAERCYYGSDLMDESGVFELPKFPKNIFSLSFFTDFCDPF
jgi:hypothetical protein